MPARYARSNDDNNSFPHNYRGWSPSRQETCLSRSRLGLAVPCLLLVLITSCAWPTYRQNPARTGRSSINTSSNTGTLQWSYSLGFGQNQLPFGPVVGITSPTQGGIYLGDLLGNLYSLTPAGNLAWMITLPNGIAATPNAVGSDGTIYVLAPTQNGELYAVSPSGNLNWTFSPPGGPSRADLAVYTNCTAAAGCQSAIYVGNQCGVLYALNSDGSVRWTFGTFQRDCSLYTPTTSPAIAADGTIYAGIVDNINDGTGVLFALNSGGTLLWSTTAYGAGTPAVDGNSGNIYVRSFDLQHLYAFNSAGALQWKVDAPYQVDFSLPAIAADGTVYIGTTGQGLWAFNSNGTIKWQASPGGQSYVETPTIGGDGTIYASTILGSLLAINPDSTLKWSTTLCGGAGGTPFDNEPVIGLDGTIYMILEYSSNEAPCPLEAFH